VTSLPWLSDSCSGARPSPLARDGSLYYSTTVTSTDIFAAQLEPGSLALKGEPSLYINSFLGRNRLQTPLYDFATGGCSDGLGREELNDNEGAESTLAFHHAALLLDAAGVRAADREPAAA